MDFDTPKENEDLRLDEFQKKILKAKFKNQAEITFEEGAVGGGIHRGHSPYTRITIKALDMFSTVLNSYTLGGPGFVRKDMEEIVALIDGFLEIHN